MSVLPIPRHERFAQELAAGLPASTAYVRAGYSENRGNAATLKQQQSIQNRVTGLLAQREEINAQATATAVERVALTKEWVLDRLMRNASIELGEQKIRLTILEKGATVPIEVEVTDRDASAATKTLEVLGKELGLFKGAGTPVETHEAASSPEPHTPIIDFAEVARIYGSMK